MLSENAKLIVQLSAYIALLEQTVQHLQGRVKELEDALPKPDEGKTPPKAEK